MSISVAKGCCYHCGLPNQEGDYYPVVINAVEHNMCCPGCQAVAEAIVSGGLESYYEFRTETAERGDAALDNTMAQLAVYDEPELQEEFVYKQGQAESIQLTVEGITCAACAWLIEKQLSKLPGLRQVSVNVAARRAFVVWNQDELKLSAILSRLKSIGYRSLPFQHDQHEASYKKEHKAFLKKLGLAGIMTMQVMMLAMGQYFDILGNIDAQAQAYFNAVGLLLTTPVVFYSASVFYISAFKALMSKSLNMDVPVTIAIFATYAAGIVTVNSGKGEVYFESICMFVFFLLISRFLEHRSRQHANLISANMLKLIPVTANKLSDGKSVSVLAKQLKKHDLVLVKAGETVPIDGIIVEGSSSFDESILSGEFEPVSKTSSDKVYAGSLNQEGSVLVKASASVKHAMMNQILRLQESALLNKPKIATTADKLSRYFVFIVLLISGLTFGFWHWQGNEEAFWITISILVATCPCALGLATPSALTCAMAKLNKQGILLKRADALEQLNQISDIVFDKTGTLTQGRFSCHKMWINKAYFTDLGKDKINPENFVLSLSQVIESRSEHPIAKAFTSDDMLKMFNGIPFFTELDIEELKIEIGSGISAVVKGENYVLGSQNLVASFLQSQSLANTILQKAETHIQKSKGASVFLAGKYGVIAVFYLSDTMVEDAKQSIEQLRRQWSIKQKGEQTKTLRILSGDSVENTLSIAQALNIDTAKGACSPSQKLKYIQELQEQNRRVLMLGDGINDAPVLAAADVSVAVGNASDLAKNAADVILLQANLSSLLSLISIANRTSIKIKQNIGWALGYNVLVLPFAMLGYLTPWQAALGMSLSSIIVVYNSSRLMK